MGIKRVLTQTTMAGLMYGAAASGYAADLDGARNLPEDGKVLFFMGQDSDTLSDYKHDVLDQDIEMPRPGGFTIYRPLAVYAPEDVPPQFANIRIDSLTGAGNWGDNEHNLMRSMEEYPNAAIAIGLDLKDPLNLCGAQHLRGVVGTGDEDVVDLTPQYHEMVDQIIHTLKETERPVYLRIGYEFDGPWNCYQPDLYKETFRFIKQRIDALEADNIATVWHGAGYFFDDFAGRVEFSASTPGHLDRWYPGDEYVDWMAVSTFLGDHYATYQAPGVDQFIAKKPRELQNEFLDFAREHGKPMLLAESSPQGFNIGDLDVSAIFQRQDIDVSAEEIWSTWYEDWFNFIEDNKDIIRGVAYINSHWNEAPLWRCDEGAQTEPGQSVPFDPANPDAPICAGGAYWGDARVQANDYILENFKSELEKPFYVNGGEGVALPGLLVDEKTTLKMGESLDYKILVEEQGDVVIKVKPHHYSYGILSVTVAGDTQSAYVYGKHPVKFKFKNVSRDQHNVEISTLYGSVKLDKVKVKQRGKRTR